MIIEPLSGIVVVSPEQKKLEKEIRSKSNIILALNKECVNDRETTGIIRFVSKTSKFKIGTKVYFDKTCGIDFPTPDEDFMFLKETSILGIEIKDE